MGLDILAADSGSSPARYLTVLYVLQLAFGAVVFATNPKREGLPDTAQRARSGAIWSGLIPCFGFMLFAQLTFLVIYRMQLSQVARYDRAQAARVKEMENDRRKPDTGSGASSGRNPFL